MADYSIYLVMSEKHPLAEKEDIRFEDLADYIEICHADPYVPSLPAIDVKKAELSAFVDKHINVFERASQFELLENVPTTFMWVSSLPEDIIKRHKLVVKNAVKTIRFTEMCLSTKRIILSLLSIKFSSQSCATQRGSI